MPEDSKLERCIRVLEAIQERGELATRDVMELLAVDRQTAMRDLRSLREAGVPLLTVGHGARRRYRLESAWRRAHLSPSAGDVLALHVGRQVLRFVEDCADRAWLGDLREGLAPAFGPAEERTSLHERFVYLGEPDRTYRAADPVICEVLRALLTEHELELVAEGARWQRLQPLLLALHRDALILVAQERGAAAIGIPLTTTVSARCLDTTFRFPRRFTPQAELSRLFPALFAAGAAAAQAG